MVRLKPISEVGSEQKIVRFVDEPYFNRKNGSYYFTFPFNSQSYYKTIEDHRKDNNESTVKIDFGNSKHGCHYSCNDVLISCWSVMNKEFISKIENNPHIKNNGYAVVSTVGLIVSIIERLVVSKLFDIYKSRFKNDDRELFLNSYYGPVQYYNENGIPLKHWEASTDIKKGVDISLIQTTFNKENKFFDEQEFRFALALNPWVKLPELSYPEIKDEQLYGDILSMNDFFRKYVQ